MSSSSTAQADSVLRLPELLQAAADANPSLQASRLRAQALASRPAQAGALPDPVVGTTVFAFPIVTARGPQRSQWRVQQSFPFPGTRTLRQDAATFRAEAARSTTDALAQTLAVQIRHTYYTLYRVQEETRVTREFQADLRQFEDAALSQYEVGTEGQPAVLKAQLERDRLSLRLETLAAEQQSALETLARLTGLPRLPDTSVEVTDPADAPSPELGDAMRQRPEAASLRADIDRAETNAALARKETWPSFTVGVQYVDVAGSDLTPTMTGRDALAVSLGVKVPLWRNSERAQVAEAQIEQRRAQTELEAFELEVRTQIADLQRRIKQHRAQLRLLESRLVPKAETALDATLSAYQTGTSDFLDLLDAQRTLFQLRLQRIGIRTRLLQTTAQLERTAGQTSLPAPSSAE